MEKEKSFEQVLTELVEKDLINEPDHYKGKNGMEVIDVIKNFAPCPEYAEGFFFGNVVKYVLRHSKKNGLEDLKKAQKYLGWLIECLERGKNETGTN